MLARRPWCAAWRGGHPSLFERRHAALGHEATLGEDGSGQCPPRLSPRCSFRPKPPPWQPACVLLSQTSITCIRFCFTAAFCLPPFPQAGGEKVLGMMNIESKTSQDFKVFPEELERSYDARANTVHSRCVWEGWVLCWPAVSAWENPTWW